MARRFTRLSPTLAMVLALCLCTVCLLSAEASADEPSAEQLLEAGHNADRKGNTEQSRDFYRGAFEKQQRFDTAANLGLAELKLGDKEQAAKHLRLALESFPEDGDPALRAKLAEALARAGGSVATPTTQGPSSSEDHDYSVAAAVMIATGATLTAAALSVGAALLSGAEARHANSSDKSDALAALNLPEPCVTHAVLCEEIENNSAAGDDLRTGGIIAMATGGGLAAITIIFAVLATSGDDTGGDTGSGAGSELAVVPWIDPGAGAGAMLSVRF